MRCMARGVNCLSHLAKSAWEKCPVPLWSILAAASYACKRVRPSAWGMMRARRAMKAGIRVVRFSLVSNADQTQRALCGGWSWACPTHRGSQRKRGTHCWPLGCCWLPARAGGPLRGCYGAQARIQLATAQLSKPLIVWPIIRQSGRTRAGNANTPHGCNIPHTVWARRLCGIAGEEGGGGRGGGSGRHDIELFAPCAWG